MYKYRFVLLCAAYLPLTGAVQASDAFVTQIGGAPVTSSFSMPQASAGSVQASVFVPQIAVSVPDIALSIPQVPSWMMTDFGSYFSGYVLPAANPDTSLAGIVQVGDNNSAGIYQSSLGNAGLISQHGDNSTGWLAQVGTGNSAGIYQTGNWLNASVSQIGNGNSALVVQAN